MRHKCSLLLGISITILMVSGCTTCRRPVTGMPGAACSSCDSGCSSGSGCRCKPPVWYWSHGMYIPLVDDFITSWAARSCARTSLKRQNGGKRLNSDDFRQGYIQAFEDRAQGSGGVMPTVAPPKYWKAHNRSIRGHSRAEDWFAGYRAGLSDGCYKQISEQTTIPISHNGGNGNCY